MENIYPLIYKPGIKRDGSTFQSDYCTAGQWIRFQRGCIRKMGGMKGISVANKGSLITKGKSIVIVPFPGNMQVYIAGKKDDNRNSIDAYNLTQDFEDTFVTNKANNLGNANYIWQHEFVIQGSQSYLVSLMSPSTLDINSSAACDIVIIPIQDLSQTTNVGYKLTSQPNLKGLSGLLFASNYLFLYGINGLVQWSKPNDPLNFSNPDKRTINISNSKIIYAASIRGGVNNPAILFWTTTSVIRCINNPTSTTPADTLAFQIDVLSKSSSIISSRCVVEYDGFFYWPGTNRFYQYTGVVRRLPNTMSLNYFFNNIDMRYRQNVFGVKQPQYGEIHWHYPEKLGTPGRLDVPEGENTRVLIYNVDEDSWNDTALSRTCGTYSEEFGFMATYGPPLTSPRWNIQYLFRHEYETFNSAPTSIAEQYRPNFGSTDYSINYISSGFTTPTISWAAFNPIKQLTGANRWMIVNTIEPDFTLMPSDANGGTDMTVIVDTKQYPQDFTSSSSQPYRIPIPLTNGQDSNLAKVDIGWQGRYISFRFLTTRNFEMGTVMLQLGIGDGQ